MIIAKLRIAAIISLILFFILMFAGVSGPYRFQFNWLQHVLLLISLVIFAIILILQVYRFAVNYNSEDDAEENSTS